MGVVSWRLFAPITRVSYTGVNLRKPQISLVSFVCNFTRGRASCTFKRSEDLLPVIIRQCGSRLLLPGVLETGCCCVSRRIDEAIRLETTRFCSVSRASNQLTRVSGVGWGTCVLILPHLSPCLLLPRFAAVVDLPVT